MVKFFYAFLLAALQYLIVSAQLPQYSWTKVFGGCFLESDINSVVDEFGNIYTAAGNGELGNGAFSDFDPGPDTVRGYMFGGEDVFITKLDSSGNFNWGRFLGGKNSNDRIRDIRIDNNNNLLVAIYATGDSVFLYPDTINPIGFGDLLLKFDSAGNLIRTYSSLPSTYSFDLFNNGDILISDNQLSRIDSTGGIIWQTSGLGGCPCPIDIDIQENIYMANLDYSSGSFLKISKLNSNGMLIWQDSIDLGGNPNGLNGLSIISDQDRGVYIHGIFDGTVDFDPGPFNVPMTASNTLSFNDTYLLKLDTAGNYLWSLHYPGDIPAMDEDAGNSIATDIFGNVYTMSRSSDTIDINPGPSAAWLLPLGRSYAITSYDPIGNLRWGYSIPGTCGQSISLDYGKNDDLIITGAFYGDTVDFNPSIDVDTISGGGVFITKIISQSPFTNTANASKLSYIIYPNPTDQFITIQLGELSRFETTIDISDVLGKRYLSEVFNRTSSDLNEIRIDVSELNSGLYFLSITQNDINVTEKIIITRL